MDTFGFGVLVGAVLYAAVGLLGVVVYQGHGPSASALTEGYGVAYRTAARSDIIR